VAEAAQAAPRPTGPPRPPDLLLDGLSLVATDGRAAAVPTLRDALRAFLYEEISVEKGLQWGTCASAAASILWDFESSRAVLSRQTALARSAGALAPLRFTLNGEAFNMAWRGELATAAVASPEVV
jgi:hypothetical protein